MAKQKNTGAEIEAAKIDQLHQDDHNFNKGTEEGAELLRTSLQKFGAGRSILLDKNNRIIAGNKTAREAAALGLDDVIVVKTDGSKIIAVQRTDVDLDSKEGREMALADNATAAANLSWEIEEIADQLGEAALEDWDVKIPKKPRQRKYKRDYSPRPDLKSDIKAGDIVEIGRHRLMCGDSTERDQVAKLMNGELADMVFTDPPYGVNIQGAKDKGGAIAGDLTSTAITFSFDLAVEVTKPEARFYFCGGEGNISLYLKLFDRYLHKIPKLIIWKKDNFVLKQNGYHLQYELVFYSYKDGGGGKKHWYSERIGDNASDVWDVPRDPSSNYRHITQKPVRLPERAICNSSKIGDLIYEPFAGGGSTMAAAHATGRTCYAMELDPYYCQVVIDYMHALAPELPITVNGKPYTPPEQPQSQEAEEPAEEPERL